LNGVKVAGWSDCHRWVTFLIVPLFALANAGVALNSAGLERAMHSPIMLA